ncbi:MAG: hypothetical protein U1A77_06210 [Pirellulales bacterium]
MSGSIPLTSHGQWQGVADAEPATKASPLAIRMARASLRLAASDAMTIVLLVTIALSLIFATIYEARRGGELARWYFYDAGWFVGLLATLAANLAANSIGRLPWRRDDFGAITIRLGGALLLVGVLRTSLAGIAGQVIVSDDQLVDTFLVPQRSLLAVSWANQSDVPDYRFEFTGGPVAWASHQTLDLGELDGMRARVLKYLPRARAVSQWKPDESGRGGAYLRFTLVPPGGVTPPPQELADEGYGDELVVGPLIVRLEPSLSRAYVDDFLAPTPKAERESQWGKAGRLRIYFKDERKQLDVQEQLNQRIPIGDSGVAVQIVRYLPHARPDAHGRFHPGGEEPRNPVVEIDVYLPGEEKPRRQLAFAKQPLLTLDGVAGAVCPVKFRFDHPAVLPPSGVDLLRVDSTTLWARVIQDGEYRVERVLPSASRIKLAAGFEFQIVEYLPHARREVHFESPDDSPTKPQDDSAALHSGVMSTGFAIPEFDAAAEVEIGIADIRQQFWVSRNIPLESAPVLHTPQGPLRVHFATATRPLGFQLGRASALRDQSAVAATSKTSSSEDDGYVVAKGSEQPLVKLQTGNTTRVGETALQIRSIENAGHGRTRAVIDVACDPGRPWKYAGTLIAGLGAVLSAWQGRRGRANRSPNTSATDQLSPQANVGSTIKPPRSVDERDVIRLERSSEVESESPDPSRGDDDWQAGRRAA